MKTMTLSEKQQFVIDIANMPAIASIVANPDVALYIGCQLALESNFGNSDLAIKYHNVAGMKTPHIRYNLADKYSDPNGFAHYPSISVCVADFVCWLLYSRPTNFEMDSIDMYRSHLVGHSYCPEKDYVSRIDAIYNQLFNNQIS